LRPTGGCDFARGDAAADGDAELVPWTSRVLPSVIVLTTVSATDVDTGFALGAVARAGIPPQPASHILTFNGETFRFEITGDGRPPSGVQLPFDDLFEIRVQAAIRLWRAMHGKSPGPNPARLTRQREDRLILALRALDGKRDGATHRQIAAGLFPNIEIPDRGWISHDLRDRTARLVRLGSSLMNGGYKTLLLHPYRRRTIG
jgi:hypothetical protein